MKAQTLAHKGTSSLSRSLPSPASHHLGRIPTGQGRSYCPPSLRMSHRLGAPTQYSTSVTLSWSSHLLQVSQPLPWVSHLLRPHLIKAARIFCPAMSHFYHPSHWNGSTPPSHPSLFPCHSSPPLHSRHPVLSGAPATLSGLIMSFLLMVPEAASPSGPPSSRMSRTSAPVAIAPDGGEFRVKGQCLRRDQAQIRRQSHFSPGGRGEEASR